jgi:hypothetical protein
LDFLARLASLVPGLRVNLTRFYGIFAANHRLRRPQALKPANSGLERCSTPRRTFHFEAAEPY